MDIKIEKEFKNGNKLIAVTRTVTTYFKVENCTNIDDTEVMEKNTIDTLKDNSFTGLSQEFWKKLNNVL